MKGVFKAFVRLTRPVVWRIANAYDLRIDRPLHPYGQHPLVILGDRETALQQIPRSCYFNTRSGRITIGRDSVFGEDVMVLTGKHFSAEEAVASGKELHFVPPEGRDITIGSGCYIGSGAIIIGPVTVGDFAVIGAGSVVTKDVPPRTFAAGIPARVLRPMKLPRDPKLR